MWIWMIAFFRCAAWLLMGVSLPLQTWAEPVTVIRNNGASANRIDLVILGDGYTNSDLSKYEQDVENAMTGFFAQEPFKEYQKYFNVQRIDVISPESGADHPETGTYLNTALDATYNCNGIQRAICVSYSKVMTIVNNSVAPDQKDTILVIVNDSVYGGSGGSLSVASTHPSVIELVLHEVGHSFGLLADEYNYGTCSTTYEPSQVNVTRETNRALIKWNLGGGPPTGWIALDTPVPTASTTAGVPGLYEGAKYCVTGVYRPTYRSKMESLGYPFEQINTEQLIKRVYNWISPIDASSPSGSTLTLEPSGSQTFQLTVAEPLTHSLDTTWKLDDVIVATGNSYTLNAAEISDGNHIVEAKVVDATSSVRNDPLGLLTDTRTWMVTPSASLPAAPIIGTATPGNARAIVAFTPGALGSGTLVNYTAQCGSFTATGTSSPLGVIGLTNGTTYTCKVKTTSSVGVGPWSALSNSVTPSASVPAAPTIGTATPGNKSASVAFTPGALGSGTLVNYTAKCGSLPGVTGMSSPIIVTGLNNGTAYTCKVKTTSSVGTSPWSALSNSVTPTAGGSTLPAAPTIGTATPSDKSASVNFTPGDLGSGTLVNYKAKCGSLPGVTGTSSPIIVTGLTNGTAYTCKVITYSSVGKSPWSASSNSVTPTAGGGSALPAAPTIGTATPGNASASVAFTPGALGSGTLINYKAKCGSITATGTSSPLTVTGLTNGTAYTCQVKTISSLGVGPWSAMSNSVTPVAAAP